MISKLRKIRASRKTLTKKCDDLLRKVVIAHWGNQCVICGSTKTIQAGHVFTRGYTNIKYDLRNVFPQCRSHNFLHEIKPDVYYKWYLDKFGKDAFDELYRLAHQDVRPIKTWQLEDIAKELQQELDEYEK